MYNKIKRKVLVSFTSPGFSGSIVIPMRRAKVTELTLSKWAEHIANHHPVGHLIDIVIINNWRFLDG